MIATKHLSRVGIASYQASVPHAIVSMTDPSASDAFIPENPMCRGILRLKFHDINLEPDQLEEMGIAKDEFILPGVDHAQQIAEFIFHHTQVQPVEMFITHCEAGISRSAGVASAICHILRQTDVHHRPPHGYPNMQVRRLVLRAYEERYR